MPYFLPSCVPSHLQNEPTALWTGLLPLHLLAGLCSASHPSNSCLQLSLLWLLPLSLKTDLSLREKKTKIKIKDKLFFPPSSSHLPSQFSLYQMYEKCNILHCFYYLNSLSHSTHCNMANLKPLLTCHPWVH